MLIPEAKEVMDDKSGNYCLSLADLKLWVANNFAHFRFDFSRLEKSPIWQVEILHNAEVRAHLLEQHHDNNKTMEDLEQLMMSNPLGQKHFERDQDLFARGRVLNTII